MYWVKTLHIVSGAGLTVVFGLGLWRGGFRWFNEAPVLVLFAAVALVVFKPF